MQGDNFQSVSVEYVCVTRVLPSYVERTFILRTSWPTNIFSSKFVTPTLPIFRKLNKQLVSKGNPIYLKVVYILKIKNANNYNGYKKP